MKFLNCIFIVFIAFNVQSQASVASFDLITLLKSTSVTKTYSNLTWRKGAIIDSTFHGDLKFELNGTELSVHYVPEVTFTGMDTAVIEFIDLFRKAKYLNLIFDVKASYIELRPDIYVFQANSFPTEIYPLYNDSSSLGSSHYLRISSINATNNVNVTLQNDSTFKISPVPFFEGCAYISYSVMDILGTTVHGTIIIQYVGPNEAKEKLIELSTTRGRPVLIPLISNAYSVSKASQKAKLIFDHDNAVLYKPNSTATGKDTFVLSSNNSKLTCIIDILSTRIENKTVIDDQYYTAINTDIIFDVSKNDIIKKGSYLLVEIPDKGQLMQLNKTGAFRYKPEANFEGIQIFSYKQCINGQCETALVTINISDREPKLMDYYRFSTPKNVPLFLPYNIPLDDFSFRSNNDSLKFYPIEQSVFLNYKGCQDTISGKNMLIFYPPKDYSGTLEFKIEYCMKNTGNCYERSVEIEVYDEPKNCQKQCAGDCVWPGDVNSDGEVSMLDLLLLGRNLGEQGPSRIYRNTSQFRGLRSESWVEIPGSLTPGMKHSDTDGDGIINGIDTFYISTFFKKQHSLFPKSGIDEINFPIHLNILTPSAGIGDIGIIELHLGLENHKLVNICGYSYELDYDPNVADPKSLEVKHWDNSWIRYNSAALNMYQKPWDGRLESGTIRSNGNLSSGAGTIEFINFLVKGNINLFKRSNEEIKIPLYFRNFTIMTESGALFKRPDTTIYISIVPNFSKKVDQLVSISPNPAKEVIKILSEEPIMDVALYSIDGCLSKKFSSVYKGNEEFYIGDMTSGVYILKINFLNQCKYEKVYIVK